MTGQRGSLNIAKADSKKLLDRIEYNLKTLCAQTIENKQILKTSMVFISVHLIDEAHMTLNLESLN